MHLICDLQVLLCKRDNYHRLGFAFDPGVYYNTVTQLYYILFCIELILFKFQSESNREPSSRTG